MYLRLFLAVFTIYARLKINWNEYLDFFSVLCFFLCSMKELKAAGHNISAATIVQLKVSNLKIYFSSKNEINGKHQINYSLNNLTSLL